MEHTAGRWKGGQRRKRTSAPATASAPPRAVHSHCRSHARLHSRGRWPPWHAREAAGDPPYDEDRSLHPSPAPRRSQTPHQPWPSRAVCVQGTALHAASACLPAARGRCQAAWDCPAGPRCWSPTTTGSTRRVRLPLSTRQAAGWAIAVARGAHSPYTLRCMRACDPHPGLSVITNLKHCPTRPKVARGGGELHHSLGGAWMAGWLSYGMG
jgi:hypothetical protein